MSNNGENKQQNEQKKDETKDWIELIQDFIKNPVTTGVAGLAAGFFIGTFKANKDMDALKEEHKRQMSERDQQFSKLIRQMELTNKLIASKAMRSLPIGISDEEDDTEDENTIPMEEDKKTKVYKSVNKKKHFKLEG
ncbi:MAG: hypothetical protein J0L69_14400 [Bacteroidetes bacterium]|nr:hypothetical protein [Bacteroidota bacterium]